MRPELIALDVDGTLLTRKVGVSPAHRRVVRELIARGITVAVVTGRPLITARTPHRELELATPVVCFNGVWVGSVCGRALEDAALDAAMVRAVVAALGTGPGSICVYPDPETWLVDRFTARTGGWPEAYGVPIRADAGIRNGWSQPSHKVMFVAEPEDISALTPLLRQRLGPDFHVVVSEPDRVEVHRAHATKAWGLERLAAHLGIAREAVWAVGDGDNDREMLAWAGRGFAMGQASAAVRACADAVLPSVHDDGLCGLLAALDGP